MDFKPITLPNGVRLRDPEDTITLRDDILNGAKEEVEASFPKSYGGVRLEVADLAYEGPERWRYKDQTQGILQDQYLSRKLKGTLRLIDEKTGSVLDERRQSLMRVPWMTERGTFVYGGNEHTTALQGRLAPGAYTRRTEGGLLETQFNPRPGSGRMFRVALEPETAQFRMSVKGSNLHLYSLLKDLGHADEDLEREWGPEVLELNRKGYDKRVLGRAYTQLVPAYRQVANADPALMAEAVREAIEKVQVSASVISRTLPNMQNPAKSAAWRAASVGRMACDVFAVKAANATPFAPDWSAYELVGIRAHDHIEIRAELVEAESQVKQATEAPYYDWDGTLIPRISGNAQTYLEELAKLKEPTALGTSLRGGPPVDVVTARPEMFHAAIRDTAARLGLNIGTIRHAEQKSEALRGTDRGLVDDDEAVIAEVNGALGDGVAVKAAKLRPIEERMNRLALRRGECRDCGAILGEARAGKYTHCVDCEGATTKSAAARAVGRARFILQDELRMWAHLYDEVEPDYTAYAKKFKKAGLDEEDINETLDHFRKARAKALAQPEGKVWNERRFAARAWTEEPVSQAQAEAGNYPKGTFGIHGLKVTIETAAGSNRKGWKPDGSIDWEVRMLDDYGYILGTKSERDGDHVDVFLGPDLGSEVVYCLDQIDQKTGEFDEHKFILGCHSAREAKELYLRNYSAGWKAGKITPITWPQFKAWVMSGDTSKSLWDTPQIELPQKQASTAEEFKPDLDDDAMREAYDAIYGKSKPQLAGMSSWPKEWMPPGSDSLGWVNWYRGYLGGSRTEDDDRQMKRWKQFKSRHGSQFVKNPTPRRAFALRYWAVDPLKMLPEDKREAFAAEMEDYRARRTSAWMREKTAAFTLSELRTLGTFLNHQHGAGIPVEGDENRIEQAVLRFLGGDDEEASAMMEAGNLAAQMVPSVKSAAADLGCLMLLLPDHDSTRIIRWVQDNVPEHCLAPQGIEREPHVTVLYGFDPDVKASEIKEHLPEGPIDFKLGKIKRFDNHPGRPESDVIVVEVESEALAELNAKLKKAFKGRITSDYKGYTPHLTLAYIKPAMVPSLKGHGKFDGERFSCDRLKFSGPGSKKIVTLKT